MHQPLDSSQYIRSSLICLCDVTRACSRHNQQRQLLSRCLVQNCAIYEHSYEMHTVFPRLTVHPRLSNPRSIKHPPSQHHFCNKSSPPNNPTSSSLTQKIKNYQKLADLGPLYHLQLSSFWYQEC